MKLASLNHGRDGRLVVVSRDLTRATDAFPVVATMQGALDDWERHGPRLADLAQGLEHGSVPSFRFHEQECAAPLPRACQWLDGAAYVNHVALVRKARGAEMPENFWSDPLMRQGACDANLGPRQPIHAISEEHGIDFEAEIAVMTGDVPMGVAAEQARDCIRLIMLVNAITLRQLIPAESAKGFGLVHSKPACAFSPAAVTPDELGSAWCDGKLHLPLLSSLNGQLFGRPDAGVDMAFDFGALIAYAARTRPLSAGTIIGAGAVSNRDASGGPGQPVKQGGAGYACIAEQRMVEIIASSVASTAFLRFGDTVRIEMKDQAGHSIFGAIEQDVLPHTDGRRH